MVMSDKRAANALGGKTARACDGCVQKRARWYCAADDAFLCQSCDSSVHSANQLARRHERVRLETASAKLSPPPAASSSSSWHQGFTRKARTPRKNKSNIIKELNLNNPQIDPLVPEIGVNSEEWSVDENYDEQQQQQMLFRVPEFDPFEPELGNNIVNNEDYEGNLICEMDGMDLVDFAADVESLIGVDQLECKLEEEESNVFDDEGKAVKVKDEESLGAYNSFDEDEEETKVNMIMNNKGSEMTLLRLNYESVITAWENQGSPCPWTTGSRPQFNPHDFLSSNGHHLNGGIWIYSPQVIRGNNTDMDGEREARVSRYREKRRTRLFSKKIRYEVRKLNAEKRPRMKGRFVKRTPFMGTPLPN